MGRDSGHLQVLEAMLTVMLILGAAFAVVSFRLPSSSMDNERASLSHVASDALTVLDGLRDTNGSLLHAAFAEALHCEADAVPDPGSCAGGSGANLTGRLTTYLPQGAAYAVMIGNGVATRLLYESPQPSREVVAASVDFAPDWNVTFVVPETDCLDASHDANVTLVAIRNGTLVTPTAVTLRLDDGDGEVATASHRPGIWNATLPAATRPAASVVRAETQAPRATFPGASQYQACDLEGRYGELRTALRAAKLGMTSEDGDGVAGLGKEASFSVDIASLHGLASSRLDSVVVDILQPLAPRRGEADAYANLSRVTLPNEALSAASWRVPDDSLFGAHLAVLRVKLTLTLPSTAEVQVEARSATVLHVALPSGTVPLEPPYRAVLRVWFPDWT